MKRIRTWALLLAFVFFAGAAKHPAVYAQEGGMTYAAWISTVYSADYPSVKNNVQAQKQEFSDKLDALQALGINTVVVQVRPKGDALYQSELNPWSDVLTGKQGQNPGYDPMGFMIEEAHKRGMEFHAWLNPYRVTVSSMSLSDLAPSNMAVLHPDWVFAYQGAYYYNPEKQEVKNYIRDTVQEILLRYDVDGIHFDDYFYPSNYPLPEGENGDGPTAEQRRAHVNEMVKMVGETVRSTKPGCVFGISPMGIWKNSAASAFGARINGSEGYYAVFADAKAWVENGYIDYLVPQIYWEKGNKAADYTTLVKFWADMTNGTNVKLYIGEAVYKDAVAGEMAAHFATGKEVPGVSGHFFFSARDLLDNRGGCADALKAASQAPTVPTGDPNGNTEAPLPEETPSIPGDVPVQIPAEIPSVDGDVPEKTPVSQTAPAVYSASKLFVNGEEVLAEAYNIDGYTYFKLRDIAMLLQNTGSRFAVSWDEVSQTVAIEKGAAYTAAGGELAQGNGKDKTAILSPQKLLLDGEALQIAAYNIADNNYLKLRELGEAAGFGVAWDEETRAVQILAPEL